MSELENVFCPLPRLQSIIASHSPVNSWATYEDWSKYGLEERGHLERQDVVDLTLDAFEPDNLMAKCNPMHGKYTKCMM